MIRPGPRIVVIAAVAGNGVIGADGRVPWRLPGDLAYFRSETWGKPVIFGRRTLEGIGKPLPGRFCIALSRDPGFHMDGVVTAPDLAAGIALAEAEAARTDEAEIMVAGGAQVYAAALHLANEVRLTLVDLRPAGDAFFPALDPDVWREVERVPASASPGDDASYMFVRLLRNDPA